MSLLSPVLALTVLSAAGSHVPTAFELAQPRMQAISDDVWVAKLAPDVWVLSFTHRMDDGTVFPANGLAVDTKDGAVLVDPGWEPAQTTAILGWARSTLRHPVRKAIVTHSHLDRSAGIAVLQKAGIPALGLQRTADILTAKGSPPVQPLPGLEQKPWRGPGGIEVRFPGAGHAPDNLVVWVPSARVLYGGCMIRSVTANGLGNTEDADLKAWPASVKQLQSAYPTVKVVIPGHGAIQGDPLAHTLKLLAEHAKR